MLKKAKKRNVVLKKTAALFTAAVMLLGLVPTTFATQVNATGAEMFSSSDLLKGPYQNSLNMASANYRNLNITPGTTVDEMRWTWHSRSETAGFTLFTNAAGTNGV
jgi:hypothetical protein